MTDELFEAAKKAVEKELGKPLDQGDEIALRGIWYFAKGLKLLQELDAESEQETQPECDGGDSL